MAAMVRHDGAQFIPAMEDLTSKIAATEWMAVSAPVLADIPDVGEATNIDHVSVESR